MMTKSKAILLYLSIACIMFEESHGTTTENSSQNFVKNSQRNRGQQRKAVKKQRPQNTTVAAPRKNEAQISKTLPVASVDKTPTWLKIDHTRMIRLKEGMRGQFKKTQDINLKNFNKALTDAYNYNPDIKSALRNYYATSESLSQAISGWRPSITGQASAGYALVDDQTAISQQNANGQIVQEPKGTYSSNPKSASINVTQNLYQGGTTVANTKKAESQIRASRANLRGIEQTILLKAVQVYTDLWFQREKVKTIQTSENFYQQSLDQATAQENVGESSSTDVAQALSSYERSMADRRAAQGAAENAQATYQQITGSKPPLDIKLPQPLNEIYELPPSLETFLEAVSKYNLAIIQAENDQQSAQHDVDASTGALLPSVDLEGAAGRNLNSSARSSRQNNLSAMLKVTIPFYSNGGGNWSRVRQAEQIAVKSKYALQSARNQATSDAKQAWENVRTSQDQIKFYRAAVDAGQRGVEGTRQEYMVGERPLLDVLQAESNLVDIKVNALSAQRDLIVNLYKLLSVLGELTPEVLELDVQAYDLNTYPEAVRNQWIGWQEAPSDQRRKD